MKPIIRNIALLFAIVLSTMAIGAEPEKLDDQQIADAIENEFLFDHAINVNNITTKVNKGIAELTGTVDNIQAKERATKITQMVKGVRAVSNRIKVIPPDKITDAEVRSNILNALLEDPATDSYEVSVEVDNGKVTLKGEVDSYHEKDLCGNVAKSVRGVVALSNEIDIDYKRDRADAEIKSEIEQLLKWNKQIDGGLIDVSVRKGNVKLTGTVGSAAEKSHAKWSSWIAGVKSVDVSKLKVEWWAKDTDLRKYKDVDKTDSEIKEAIKDAALYDPRVFSFNIKPEVINGWVTLRGTVDNLKAKTAAGKLAQNTVGVVNVDNRLKVRSLMPPTDAEIEANIENALFNNSITESYEIDVDVHNGIATLSGVVDSYLEKTEAEWVASGVNGITDVNNNLTVSYPYGYYWYDSYPYHTWYYTPPVKTEIVTINYPDDEKIKKEVESQLWWSPFVSADEVDVEVQNGEVILEGTVDSWREYQAASKNAWEGGAWTVINELKVE